MTPAELSIYGWGMLTGAVLGMVGAFLGAYLGGRRR